MKLRRLSLGVLLSVASCSSSESPVPSTPNGLDDDPATTQVVAPVESAGSSVPAEPDASSPVEPADTSGESATTDAPFTIDGPAQVELDDVD
jgi:hypothetical protein